MTTTKPAQPLPQDIEAALDTLRAAINRGTNGAPLVDPAEAAALTTIERALAAHPNST